MCTLIKFSKCRISNHLFICLTMVIVISAKAQSSNVHITVDNGLPNSNVMCIAQDHKGYLWLGTGNGLVKYDGYSFSIFKSSINDKNTLSNDLIQCLAVDSSGVLWIGTLQGLNKYNPTKGKFERVYYTKNGQNHFIDVNINALYPDQNGELYIVNPFGVMVFNSNDNTLRSIDSTIGLPYRANVCKDKNNTLWIAKNVLCMLPAGSDKLQKFSPQSINSIIVDNYHNNLLWGTNSKGICKIDMKTQTTTAYNFALFDERNSEKTNAYCLWQESPDKIWVGTSISGLYTFNPRKSEFKKINTHFSSNATSTDQNSVVAISPDNFGNLWVGTVSNGVYKISQIQQNFISYDKLSGVNDKVIWSVFEAKDGKIWVGTEQQGINVLDRKTGRLTYIGNAVNKACNIGPGSVGSMCQDKNGQIWAITWNGTLNMIDPKTYKVKIFRGGGNQTLGGWSFRSLCYDNNNSIWIGSLDTGFEMIDINTHKVTKPIKEMAEVHCMYLGPSGTMWCGTNKGIYAINPKTYQFKLFPTDVSNPEKIQSVEIKAFYEQNDSILWIATQGCGVYRFNIRKSKLKNFNMHNGLPSNNVYAVYPDSKGRLWMSTGYGVSCFDERIDTFYNYSKEDGLQSNEFRWNSHCKTKAGELIFGGINGFNIFNPDSIKTNRFLPKTVITTLKINNKTILPGDTLNDRVILTQSIDYTTELELTYREKDITFEFAALHFASPSKNKIACMLQGYDSEWKFLSSDDRKVSYNNLPAGNYYLKVKSANCDGLWCSPEDEVTLKISILPPWWQTWWFRLFLMLSIVTSFYLWFRIRTRRLRLQKKVLEKKVEQRTSEIKKQNEELAVQADNLQEANFLLKEHSEGLEVLSEELRTSSEELLQTNEKLALLNATKDRLFSIIAHDLRNPFQSIIEFSETLAGKFDQFPEQKKKELLGHISDSSKNAHRLLENLLDWASSQTSKVNFNPKDIQLYSIIKKTTQLLELQALSKNIQINSTIDDHLTAFADAQMIETIVRNLISNAIKFTTFGGSISIKGLSDTTRNLVGIAITDTGVGMDAQIVEKLFKIDVPQVKVGTAGERGTGLGLILCKEFAEKCGGFIDVHSQPELGSTFTLWIPYSEASTTESVDANEYDLSFEPTAETNLTVFEPLLNAEGNQYHILIVDDNPSIRANIILRLHSLFIITEASNGKEALEIALTELPDLIVSDVMMPEMDGFELCNKIKTDERTNHIPFILLTARVSPKSQMHGLNMKADEYLTKPFSVDLLIARIHNLLINRVLLREKYSKLFVGSTEYNSSEPEPIVDTADRSFITKLIHIIEENMSDPDFSVDQLGAAVNMSKSTLYRKLMAISNQNPGELIKRIRLQRAAQLLVGSDRQVSEVMTTVGYTHASYFSENFKKMFGVVPSEYGKREL